MEGIFGGLGEKRGKMIGEHIRRRSKESKEEEIVIL